MTVPNDIQAAAKAIHASPSMCVLHVTGGGVSSLQWLLTTPGASATILDSTIPYSIKALQNIVRTPSSSAASAASAAALATAAYATAVARAPTDLPVIGIGTSCALRTTRPLKGDHRAHVCVRSDTARAQYSLVLDKGLKRSRADEDSIVSRLVVQALLNACRPALESMSRQPMPLLREHLTGKDSLAPPTILEVTDAIDALLAGCNDEPSVDLDHDVEGRDCGSHRSVRLAEMQPSGDWRLGASAVAAVLPGSFNPVHHGHRRLLAAARELLPVGSVCGYEISVSNVDKPPLDAKTIRERAAQFEVENGIASAREVLVLTTEPLFSGKATLLPGTVFIIGHDTAVRLVDSKYYGGHEAMIAALVTIARNGCSFLVAGRQSSSPAAGSFLTLDQVDVPPGFDSLFRAIPESSFREDVSSTGIRAKMK